MQIMDAAADHFSTLRPQHLPHGRQWICLNSTAKALGFRGLGFKVYGMLGRTLPRRFRVRRVWALWILLFACPLEVSGDRCWIDEVANVGRLSL